jgi:hypothetical protein
MTTYFFGNIEFGRFIPTNIRSDGTPLAIIHQVKDVKEFDTPEQAWEYYTQNGEEFESYVSLDATDQNGVQYELVFKQHR